MRNLIFIDRLVERYRRLNYKSIIVINNAMGSFAVKGLSMVISFFSLPFYIRYFEDQRILGFWFTLLPVLSWILSFDLGIGNGLRNYLTKSLAIKDYVTSKKYISSAYIFVLSVAIIFFAVLFLSVFRIDWNRIFNVSENLIEPSVLKYTILFFLSGLLIEFSLKIISSILYAMQKTFVNNLIVLIGRAIMLGYLIFCNSALMSSDSRLMSLAIVRIFAVNTPFLIATIFIFGFSLKECRPNIRFYDLKLMKKIVVLGGAFLVVQLLYMLLSTTNELLITKLANSEEVVTYQIYNKIFFLGASIFILALAPTWSAITKAIAEHDKEWLESLFRKLCILGGVATACIFCVIPFMQKIVDLWLTDNTIQINPWYSVTFAVSSAVFIWSGIMSTFAAGSGELKMSMVCFSFAIIIKVLLAIVFVNLFQSWIGVMYAHIIAMSIYCIVQPFGIKRMIANVSNN